jgi:FtsZ-binding cell division protein ZapB
MAIYSQKMKLIKFRLASFCSVLGLLLVSLSASSQEATENTATRKFVSRSRLIETLAAEVESLRQANVSLSDSLFESRQQLSVVNQDNDRLKKDVKQLEENLDTAINEKLQSSHTNSVLFIFIFITGLIVLLALIWLFMRKPATVAHYQDTRTDLEDDDDEDDKSSGLNSVDHQLERIEKLGSLREKGLLTDDEFNLQKKQILGERH